MIKTPNKEIAEHIISTILSVGSKASSSSYILLVLDTVVRKLAKTHDCLKYVHLKTTEYTSTATTIKIDEAINDVAPAKLGAALNEFIAEIAGPCGGSNKKNEFLFMLKGYLGSDWVLKLSLIGVKL